jgi:hypothetical protein
MVLGHFRKRRPRLAIPILETFPVRDGLREGEMQGVRLLS